MLLLDIAKLFQLFKYSIELLKQFIVNLAQHNSQKITYFEEIVFTKDRVYLNMTRTCHKNMC
jgi:hypothetical protein